MKKNCDINEIRNIQSIQINLAELDKFEATYDIVVSTNLFG